MKFNAASARFSQAAGVVERDGFTAARVAVVVVAESDNMMSMGQEI